MGANTVSQSSEVSNSDARSPDSQQVPDMSQVESENLLNLLYAIAEDQARKDGYVHRGITCNHCGMSPLRGIRFKCANCVDVNYHLL